MPDGGWFESLCMYLISLSLLKNGRHIASAGFNVTFNLSTTFKLHLIAIFNADLRYIASTLFLIFLDWGWLLSWKQLDHRPYISQHLSCHIFLLIIHEPWKLPTNSHISAPLFTPTGTSNNPVSLLIQLSAWLKKVNTRVINYRYFAS